ncbi:MAG: cation diffusion facilitator family transporter [Candidatus Choladocola sp.]|nr:cation diffusion facilitator family transporter [Candidatus Choladocola sp.]
MVDFLVKKFVKDYEHTENSAVRTAYGTLAGIVGIVCNVFLFFLKLAVGFVVNSVSVMSDAFNNLSDAASSIISLAGVKLADRPADEEHPFGHGRMEYITALIVAFLVIEVGWTLCKSSFDKILHPNDMTFSILSVCILTASITVKLWMAYMNRKLGRRINSSVMKATAADSMGDVLTTSATILALVVYGIWGKNIDGIVGLIVSVIVIIAGINIAKDTLAPLLGEAVSYETAEEISGFVEKYEGIVGTHDLIVHSYGPSRKMASIHAEVPSNVSIETSHEIIDRIERDAMKQLGIFLVIHMDPIAVNDEKLLLYRSMAEEVVKMINPRYSLHDFRMVDGEKRRNLIFDLVVPREEPASRDNELIQKVNRMMQEKDARCCCVITVERSFCADH